ncbi:uncharacterized protein A4U43_C08F2030 [Asparagus officinalis]|nr:uncharacterized protein A4U43_C08F2030 [Asparagus officinalis]
MLCQELLGDEKLKTLLNKNEEKKLSMACRKGKKKSRNSKQINSMPNSSRVVSTLPELKVRNEGKIDCVADNSYNLCNQEYNYPVAANQETDSANTCLLPKDPGKEHAIGLVNCKHPADRKRNRGRGAKRKNTNLKKVVEPEIENPKTSIPLVAAETKLEGSVATSTLLPVSRDFTSRATLSAMSSSCNGYGEPSMVDNNKMTDNALVDCSFPTEDSHSGDLVCCSGSDKLEDGATKFASASLAKNAYEKNPQGTSQCSVANSHTDCKKQSNPDICPGITSVCDKTCFPFPTSEGNQCKLQCSGLVNGKPLEPIPSKLIYAAVNEQSSVSQNNGSRSCIHNHINTMGGISYEWPRTDPFDLTSANSPHLPAATDRLHLEVGHKQSNHFHHSFMQSRNQPRNSATEVGYGRILPSLTLPMSYDWPPVVKNCGRFNQTMTISYDSAFNPPLPASFSPGFAAHATLGMQVNGASNENDRKHAPDIFDVYDLKTASEFPDDAEGYWLAEEEFDTHAFSGRDYNQFFGGGVMYWNPAEHVGTGFSRPPSYSSEDSSWAWYEADLNRAIDDMVGMPGLPTSFSTNGLASPPTAAFCSPFDPLASGHQQIGYTVPGNDGGKILQSSSSASDFGEEKSSVSLNNSPSCVEGVKGDTLPYPVLRPIIIPSISKKGSRSEFKVNQDHRSPCLPSNRRDHPRIKRPPSPVVLCVPRVPRPPPPSPVGESRKRGFPIVRSGSSSPRHWGVRSGCHEDGNADDPRLCLDGAEVVWPSWRAKGLVGTPVAQSIQGSLLQNHLMKISQLACDQEHPDVALPLQPPDASNSPHRASLSMFQNRLHEEIEFFCKQVAAENLIKKPYINWAIKRVTRSLQVLWPRSRTNIFGSNATGLALPTSDVDLVVSLPPVRNLEPIKEAGILEGRNGIKETCLQHAARYLGNQDWVRNDSLKTIENTAIPIIMLVVEVPQDINYSNGNSSILELQDTQSSNMSADTASHLDHSSSEDTSSGAFSKTRMDDGSRVKSIRLDISFKSSSHTGLQTSELVRELTQQFPASVPLALVLKKFLADRSLDHSYSGGLSSYCLVLLITRFLQHEHHICRPITQNLGSLLMDFLYFFGNVFDPRQMRISIQGSGVYMNRERGLSIDPIHIDDPLFPSNNVGRNCFRIHQCIKAFADAYSSLKSELSHFSDDCGPCSTTPFEILRKIIPSID